MGAQRAAAEDAIAKLNAAGQLNTAAVPEALAVMVVGVAGAVDAEPDNAALWREYRQAWRELREAIAVDDDDSFDRLLADLSSPEVRDEASP